TQNITLTIDSGYRVSIASGALNPPFGFNFDTCCAAGGFTGPGSCNVKETFTPTATGPATADLTVGECPVVGGACIDITVHLTGSGVTPLAITTATLPNGAYGVAYGATVNASGGTTPYHWTVTGGALPGGLTLDASTGAIAGTPT